MQRWIYPVDKKRVNEFGQVFDEETRKELERQEQEQIQNQSEKPTDEVIPETDVVAKKTE